MFFRFAFATWHLRLSISHVHQVLKGHQPRLVDMGQFGVNLVAWWRGGDVVVGVDSLSRLCFAAL